MKSKRRLSVQIQSIVAEFRLKNLKLKSCVHFFWRQNSVKSWKASLKGTFTTMSSQRGSQATPAKTHREFTIKCQNG